MAIDRHNCVEIASMGIRLMHGSKWETSRALRRFLKGILIPNTSRLQTFGELEQSRANPACDIFQMFASNDEEGYSPKQRRALGVYAKQLAEEMAAAELSEIALVEYKGVVDDMGVVFNHYRVPIHLATASLKELQQTVRVVVVLAEFLVEFSTEPNLNALRDCPVYRYRGLPCSIAKDEDLWCINGGDRINGGCGVLEWCYDEEDALYRLERMRKHPHQFQELSASTHRETFKNGGMHPLIREAFQAQA